MKPDDRCPGRQLMLRAMSITAVALLAAVTLATPAEAGLGDDPTNGGNGFRVAVQVNITSDSGKVVQSGSRTYSVPAKCWWKPAAFDLDGTDTASPEEFNKWMTENPLQGHAGAGNLARPSYEEMQRVLAASKAGQAYRWYAVECQPGVDPSLSGYTSLGGTAFGQRIPLSYRAFLPGEVPEPLIAVEDLAETLWDEAQQGILAPTLDRNPKMTGTNAATVVNLPTWFWVTNPGNSLADDGTLTLTASVPGTPVNMTLVAKSSDVAISSVAGSNTCPVAQAKYAYGAGKAETGACTVTFDRANAGWPVTATVTWTANWTGNDGTGPQAGTASLTRSTTVNVPVVEVQVPNR
jgi:hypothetical protein